MNREHTGRLLLQDRKGEGEGPNHLLCRTTNEAKCPAGRSLTANACHLNVRRCRLGARVRDTPLRELGGRQRLRRLAAPEHERAVARHAGRGRVVPVRAGAPDSREEHADDLDVVVELDEVGRTQDVRLAEGHDDGDDVDDDREHKVEDRDPEEGLQTCRVRACEVRTSANVCPILWEWGAATYCGLRW